MPDDVIYNKVVVVEDGTPRTIIDLNGDTLDDSGKLLQGVIAHARDGETITGTYDVESSKTVAGSMAQQTITPTTGKSAMEEVVVEAITRTETQDTHGTCVTFG